MIREPKFRIDKRLINAQIEDYDCWLKKEWFEDTDNCQDFMNELINTLETECKVKADVKQMFEVMNMLAFHTRFGKIVERMKSVRDALVESLSSAQCKIEYTELAGFFQEYQYKNGIVFVHKLWFGTYVLYICRYTSQSNIRHS